MIWPLKPLGDLCDITVGRTPARNNPDFWGAGEPWLSIADMNQGLVITGTKEQITPVAAKSGKLINEGTVLLSFKLSIGKVAVAGRDLYTNEAIAALPIRNKNEIMPGYLVRALQTLDLTSGANRAAMGSTLNKAKLQRLPIPVPTLPEQRRITAILDHADALRAKRRQVITHLDDLAQSIFLDMFGNPLRNPMAWSKEPLGGAALRVTDGEHKTPRRAEVGVPLLSARSVQSGWIDFGATDFVPEEEYESLRRRIDPQKGDVLISCSGTIGRVARVREQNRFAMVRSVALVRPGPDISSGFLEGLLSTTAMNTLMNTRANSSAQANLFQNQIKDLPVILPPLQLQKTFETQVNEVAHLKQSVLAELIEIDRLFASLQSRAFSGAL